jgi:hypothetical protein
MAIKANTDTGVLIYTTTVPILSILTVRFVKVNVGERIDSASVS